MSNTRDLSRGSQSRKWHLAKLLSQEPAPAITKSPVLVHYFESGNYKTMTVDMRRPVYFDNIVVATVREILPRVPSPYIPMDSVRNFARRAYHAARAASYSFASPANFAAPILDTRGTEPNNMAHLLMHLIPYCLYARKVVGSDITYLFRKVGTQYARLLEIFNIVPNYEYRKVKAHVIKIRGTRGLSAYDLISTFDCVGINFLPEVYKGMQFPSSLKFEKIFLARRDSRGLTNQAEIEELVTHYGYKTIFMEDYSLLEQLSIGAQARFVIAVHGAAMSFLIMNTKIDWIIELFPPNVYHEYFPVCLSPRFARYDQIISDFDPAITHSGWDAISHFKGSGFSANASLLKSLLSESD
jgi:hypothetical protein